MKRKFFIVAFVVVAFSLAGTGYYFLGHHNHLGSRSFYLEKDIRDLLFRETHEPTDYPRAARDYRSLLDRIRFDNRRSNYTARYEKALARSELKAQALGHFDLYRSTGEIDHLKEGWALISGAEYETLEEYGFTSFYWNGTRIDDAWIEKEMKNGFIRR